MEATFAAEVERIFIDLSNFDRDYRDAQKSVNVKRKNIKESIDNDRIYVLNYHKESLKILLEEFNEKKKMIDVEKELEFFEEKNFGNNLSIFKANLIKKITDEIEFLQNSKNKIDKLKILVK